MMQEQAKTQIYTKVFDNSRLVIIAFIYTRQLAIKPNIITVETSPTYRYHLEQWNRNYPHSRDNSVHKALLSPLSHQ